MTTSLLLDPVIWDLMVDANGNIAVCSEPYSLAQDAATAIRTFLGEIYYNTTLGIDYFTLVFGQPPGSFPLIKALLVNEALGANPDIVAAQVFISGFTARSLSGQVHVTNRTGAIITVGF